ncbi:MAG: tetratricopeptide repeat protein, partial [Candidatus Cloacimonetes bacterium]|nr:tetratricopeptide repeat protein [Candidatus Cloacimonadota bacterium]
YGDNLFCLEKFEEAKKIYLENLVLQKELNDIEGIAHTYGNLGNIAKSENDYDEAEIFYKRQQEALAQIGDKEGEGKAYFNWAMIEIEKDKPKDAIPKLEKALELFEACSFQMGIDLAKGQLEEIRKSK